MQDSDRSIEALSNEVQELGSRLDNLEIRLSHLEQRLPPTGPSPYPSGPDDRFDQMRQELDARLSDVVRQFDQKLDERTDLLARLERDIEELRKLVNRRQPRSDYKILDLQGSFDVTPLSKTGTILESERANEVIPRYLEEEED